MSSRTILEQYIAAFNENDTATYSSFYAPDVVLRNGAGATLIGPRAIIAYYDELRPSLHRTMELKALAADIDSLAAALSSQFTVLAPRLHFAGTDLMAGDKVELDSIVLYMLRAGKFARITSDTVRRIIVRKEET